ncbi:MAG: electron transporter [Actinobacteria bacterium]|nr:MAG: electron transporter [Actinomycetota bacterium]
MTTLNHPIVVLVDHHHGTLTTSSAQALTLARSLTSGDIIAVVMGEPDTQALSTYGATTVLLPDVGGHSQRVSAVVADALFTCITTVGEIAAVITNSHYLGREVCARLAITMGTTAAVDITRAWNHNGAIHAEKPVLAGAWTTTFHAEGAVPILGLRPSSIEEVPVETPTTPATVSIPVTLSEEAQAVRIVSSTEQENSGRVSLTEARNVVVGGRGTDGDFTLVEELADLLGGAVGATRVCSDEGWVPRALQIGQTGASVAPNLYIGLGVSGAIHHTVGMQSSRHIVAVCDDPDAPIFDIADFGVVGDLFEVIPQAIETLRIEGNGQA